MDTRMKKYAKYNTNKSKTPQKKTVNKNLKKSKTQVQTKKSVRKPIKKQIKKDKPRKKIRLKYKAIFLFVIVLFFLGYFIYHLLNLPISNIFISGNTIYSDQEIIELAKLQDYPSTFSNLSIQIESRLEKDIYIYKAKVTKKNLFQVYINIEENYPLFYSIPKKKTILYDLEEVEQIFSAPTLVNLVSDSVYDKFIEKMRTIDRNILNRISEIQYTPNDVDDTRFMFKMNDDNYVYINFSKFDNINDYLDIIKFVDGKKGILNLDAGNSFEIKQ